MTAALTVVLTGCGGSSGGPAFDPAVPTPSSSPVTKGSLEPGTDESGPATRGRNAPCRPSGPRRLVQLLPDVVVPALRVRPYRTDAGRVLVKGFTVAAQRVEAGCVVRYVAPAGCLGAVRITRAVIPAATIPASVVPATTAPGGKPVPAKRLPAVSTPAVVAPGAFAPQDCRAWAGTSPRALTRTGAVRTAVTRDGLSRPGDVRNRRCDDRGCVPEIRLDSVWLPAVDLPRVTAGRARIEARPLGGDGQTVLADGSRTAVATPTPLLFAGAASSLRPGSAAALRATVRRLRTVAGGLRLAVEAHSDDSGTASYALGLSRRRARTVAAWLAGNGFEQATITARGYGDTAPAGARSSRVVVSAIEGRG